TDGGSWTLVSSLENAIAHRSRSTARRRRLDRARSRHKNVRHLDRATRAQPASDGRERNCRGWLAIRRPDPGRKRLRSLHQPDIAQIVAPAARELDLPEYGG